MAKEGEAHVEEEAGQDTAHQVHVPASRLKQQPKCDSAFNPQGPVPFAKRK